MSDELLSRSEVLKLARLLGCPPERLSYLERLPAQDIRTLREQVTDMLFSADEGTLKRLAASSRLLPVSLVALIGERAFTPVLAARITGLLDPARAVEMASTMPAEYLADVAAHLDPRRSEAVIAGIPPGQVAKITRVLAARDEFVTMGRFVGHLSPESLQAAVGELDDAGVLRAAFVMEEKERLEDLMGLVGEDRLEGLVDAARREELWDEIVDLVNHLSPARRAELMRRASESGFVDQLGPLKAALAG